MMNNNYNPDVLNCIANLSNDEVFTPPELANKMLDLLPQELFRSSKTTFLDPFTKSGVFLREIVKRLDRGLANEIPDRQKRIDHILHHQVFGIACTELTSLLARRSVYCSKTANGQYSISKFDTPEGNILYKNIKHTWVNGKCKYCGASQSVYDRGSEAEQYAYMFIHTDNPKQFFKNMKFDVIIGNPPYQLNVGVEKEDYAIPLYHKFVLQAKKLRPRFVSIIMPARWYAGGRGMDDFRADMLQDNHLRVIHDFPESNDCFSGVHIRGGICYFLWDRDNAGLCSISTYMNGTITGPVKRKLLEEGSDTFIRYNQSISILHKIYAPHSNNFSSLVSSQTPFGIVTSYKGFDQKKHKTDIKLYKSGHESEHRGQTSFVPIEMVTRGLNLIKAHKVYLGEASSSVGSFPHSILTQPFYGEPDSVCTQSYLVIGPFGSKKECMNVISYISTRVFRFMVLMRKNTQHNMSHVFKFVPLQDFSHPWTDEMLYKKYGLTDEEIAFIESMIRPME